MKATIIEKSKKEYPKLYKDNSCDEYVILFKNNMALYIYTNKDVCSSILEFDVDSLSDYTEITNATITIEV